MKASVQEDESVVSVPGRYVPAPDGSGRLLGEAKVKRLRRMVLLGGRVVYVEGMDTPC